MLDDRQELSIGWPNSSFGPSVRWKTTLTNFLAKPVLYSGHAGAKERKTQVVTETVEA